jgi:hypothetical protein
MKLTILFITLCVIAVALAAPRDRQRGQGARRQNVKNGEEKSVSQDSSRGGRRGNKLRNGGDEDSDSDSKDENDSSDSESKDQNDARRRKDRNQKQGEC